MNLIKIRYYIINPLFDFGGSRCNRISIFRYVSNLRKYVMIHCLLTLITNIFVNVWRSLKQFIKKNISELFSPGLKISSHVKLKFVLKHCIRSRKYRQKVLETYRTLIRYLLFYVPLPLKLHKTFIL